MSGPTVTITVGGVPVTATTTVPTAVATLSEASLYMVYVQAVKGDQRKQFVILPPSSKALGCADEWAGEGTRQLYLHRIQEFVGNRSKWFESYIYSSYGQKVPGVLESTATSDGWELGGVVVVPLEQDDYVKMYSGETSHKALRAIDRALNSIGLSIK